MTVYDSSVLIDYLSGEADAVEYVEGHVAERAIAPPLVLFEVYQGEVFKSGSADFGAVDGALDWLTVTEETASMARAGAELQNELESAGSPLTARDAYIAGVAFDRGETLAVSDDDFDVQRLTELVAIDFI